MEGRSGTTLGCKGGNVDDTHCIRPVAANHRKKCRGKGGERRNSASSNQEVLRDFSRISDLQLVSFLSCNCSIFSRKQHKQFFIRILWEL